MKLSRRSRWVIFIVGFLTITVLILTQVRSVQATFTNVHVGMVLLRVEREIMQKSPAGQYYEALFWKHNDELMQIARDHPENNEEFWRVTRLFIPGLEALLNGEGDTAQITSEQVESLKAELDWLASVGSPFLREDIEKEEQRLPLDYFAGMTMSDALDFINSSWTPDSAPVQQNLVPDSDGQWAYYLYNNVYLEYPASYYVQASESSDYIYFVPSTGMPEYWSPCVVRVHIWNVLPADELSASPYPRYTSQGSIVWESPILNGGFGGVEFIASRADWSTMDLDAFQYNAEIQRAVLFQVLTRDNPVVAEPSEYSLILDQQYEYLQHMISSVRFQP